MALPVFLAGMIPGLINKGIDLIDKKFQSESEREQAKSKLIQEAEDRLSEAWDKEQAHITERHKNDMTSDSWLSKNIRPLVLIYLMGLFTLAFIQEVDITVMELLERLLMLAFSFYFGARGIEKVVKTIVSKN